jgi:hypothetical protein
MFSQRRPFASEQSFVVVAMPTREELRNVGTGLRRLYPVPDGGDFQGLLDAMDDLTGTKSAPEGNRWI